jgi:hypothetical protein
MDGIAIGFPDPEARIILLQGLVSAFKKALRRKKPGQFPGGACGYNHTTTYTHSSANGALLTETSPSVAGTGSAETRIFLSLMSPLPITPTVFGLSEFRQRNYHAPDKVPSWQTCQHFSDTASECRSAVSGLRHFVVRKSPKRQSANLIPVLSKVAGIPCRLPKSSVCIFFAPPVVSPRSLLLPARHMPKAASNPSR